MAIGVSASKSSSESESAQGPTSADMARALGITVEQYELMRNELYDLFPFSIENMMKGAQFEFDITQQAIEPLMENIQLGSQKAAGYLGQGLAQGRRAAMGQPTAPAAPYVSPSPDLSFLTEAEMPAFEMQPPQPDPQQLAELETLQQEALQYLGSDSFSGTDSANMTGPEKRVAQYLGLQG